MPPFKLVIACRHASIMCLPRDPEVALKILLGHTLRKIARDFFLPFFVCKESKSSVLFYMSIQFSTKRVDQIEKVPEKFQFHVAAPAVGFFFCS